MNCQAACGSIGHPGAACSYFCKICGIKCEGKFAKSLSVCIGKNSFKCNCVESKLQRDEYDLIYNGRSIKRRIDLQCNQVF